MLKLFNSLLLTVILVFSAFVGIKSYEANKFYAEADELFRQKIELEQKEIQDQIKDSIKISEQNKSSNYSSITSFVPGVDSGKDVEFADAREALSYATNKVKNSKTLYSTISGSATLSGSASIANIPNTVMQFSGRRAKNNATRFFGFNIKGQILSFNANLGGEYYTEEGMIYKFHSPASDTNTYSKDEFLNTFKWDMTSVFHLADSETLANIVFKEESFMYVSRAKEYHISLSLDTTSFSSNFISVIKASGGSLVSWNNIAYNSITMNIIIDNKGNFKSIHSIDDISLSMSAAGISGTGRLQFDTKEVFSVIDNGTVAINKPSWF